MVWAIQESKAHTMNIGNARKANSMFELVQVYEEGKYELRFNHEWMRYLYIVAFAF